jgi:serine/threonine-protein kinase
LPAGGEMIDKSAGKYQDQASMNAGLESDKVGSFRIIEKIGEGGMAIIYKAVQPSLKRTVVIKKLKDPNREIIERFKKEAFVSASFSQENVLAIYDFIYAGRTYYLVMEYVDGHDLRDIIDFSAPLPSYVAALIIREVATGLEYTHNKNIIHRDIKPSNILISNLGEVKLIDFGVAKDETPSKLTVTGMIVGTPSYMSPEQANGDPIGPQSDVYSLGVLLFEMLTGVKPFLGDTNTEVLMKIVKGKYPSPKKYNREIPWRLVNIVKKAMRRDADKRYHNSSELIHDLDLFIPWKEKANKKTIISQFLRKYETDTLRSTDSAFSPPRMYVTSTKRFWFMTAAVIFSFMLACVQIGRFLINERFVPMEVTTDSQAASVYLDGRFLGRISTGKQNFPNISAGEHSIEVRSDSDKGIYHEVLYFKPGKAVSIEAILPDRNTLVSLSASSEPEGAELYLDEKLLGKTPLRRLRLKSGSHTVKLKKEGFLPISEQLNLDESQSYSLHYRLTLD